MLKELRLAAPAALARAELRLHGVVRDSFFASSVADGRQEAKKAFELGRGKARDPVALAYFARDLQPTPRPA